VFAAGGGAKGKKKGGKVIAKDEDSDIYKVVKMLMEQQYDPVSLPYLAPGSQGCLPVLMTHVFALSESHVLSSCCVSKATVCMSSSMRGLQGYKLLHVGYLGFQEAKRQPCLSNACP